MVLSHLQFWSSYLKNKSQLEKGQKKATKMTRSFPHLSYQQRLELCNLKKRQLSRYMLEVYKIMHKMESGDKVNFPKILELEDIQIKLMES